MRISRSLVLAAASAALVGCQPKKTPPPAPPSPGPAQVLASIRSTYQQQDPHTRVGLVLTTASDDGTHLAAVGDVPLKDFKTGDAVTFVDPDNQFITMGTVREIDKDKDLLIVAYEVNAAAKRPPRHGDLAVRFNNK